MKKSTYRTDGVKYKEVIRLRRERIATRKQKDKEMYNYVVKIIAEELDMFPSLIKSKSRKQEVVEARQMVYKLCIYNNMCPYHISIADGRTNASIMHSLKQFKNLYEVDKNYKAKFDLVLEIFHENLHE